MIFIDPVSKLHTRKELKHSLRRNNGKNTLFSQDSIDLSDEADYLNEFILTSDGIHSLTAEMSCTVLILQAAINAICKKDFPIRSIQELKQPAKEWQLNVQPPPIERNNRVAVYSDKHTEKDSDPLSYQLVIPVLSQDDQQHKFQLSIGCNRLFAHKHDWPTPPKAITANLVSAPYVSHFVSQLPTSLRFEFDDDGEPDQLQELQLDDNKEKNATPSMNLFEVAGLRVWIESPNSMKLYILGDANLGAIFVGNVSPQQGTHEEEKTIIKPEDSSFLDIEA